MATLEKLDYTNSSGPEYNWIQLNIYIHCIQKRKHS
jgi:hypothetical protein